MNASDKAAFICELCDRVRDSAVADTGRMPEEWDGHELRQLLADRFAGEVSWSRPMQNKRGARRRDYENARATLNL